MEKNPLLGSNAIAKHHLSPKRSADRLQLTGSQVNLTARCQRNGSPPTVTWRSRPCSAFQTYSAYSECKSAWKRPMSADNDASAFCASKDRSFKSNPPGCSLSEGDPVDEDPVFKHSYTYLSSNLLRSLIRNPWNSEGSESASNSSDMNQSDKSLGCRIREMARNDSPVDCLRGDYIRGEFAGDDDDDDDDNDGDGDRCVLFREKVGDVDGDADKSQPRELNFERWFSQPVKEVRFVQEDGGDSISSSDAKTYVLKTEAESEFGPPQKDSDTPPKGCDDVFVETGNDVCHCEEEEEEGEENPRLCTSECPFSCCRDTNRREETDKRDSPQPVADETPPEDADDNRESTYDEIVSIINVLEQEETESLLHKEKQPEQPTRTEPNKKSRQLSDIYSYLDEIEKSSEETINMAKSVAENAKTSSKLDAQVNGLAVTRLEDLLQRNTVELAQEVLALRIQIEDQCSGIKLLQTTIAEMKEAAKIAKSTHQDELFKVTNDAEVAVQRHQKFIKQLLQEKKQLNEKVGKLVEDLKSGEERYQRNLKTIEERHAIEIQRVKETQAVAEKLKREKWIDVKTQKIKEMTVKGLEPELSRMAARQQQEITELRNLHRSELEAVELRAARRSTELLDQLRSELVKDKEEAILRETNALRVKMEKQFEDERSQMEHELKRLREERRREKEMMESKEHQMQDTLQEMKRGLEREKERERQRLTQEFQEQMEALNRRHQSEVKTVRDSLEIEKEAWMNNYKKQQSAKFLEKEAELHHRYKRERDRDIELVIERLENEASLAQQELTQAAENKLKRMREKFEEEIKEMESTEATLKSKLSEAKAQLLAKDDQIAELNSVAHQTQTDMNHLKKLCEEMSAERSNLKQVIAREFDDQLAQAEKEREELRSQIAAIKTNHVIELAKKDQLAIQAKAEAQQELNQVYNRVKTTVSKKDQALQVLRDQYKTVLERCAHLEKMLENQRRNLLLK